MLKQVIYSCQYLLNNFPLAQEVNDYLSARLSQSSVSLFKFGYFPDSFNLPVLTSILDASVLTQLKLIYNREIEDSLGPRQIITSYFENYPLIIPFHDTYGNPVALIGRTLLSDQERKISRVSKYKNTIFHKGNYLFGLFENKKSIIENDLVYIVEGQFDVIKAVENNFTNIVALSNSNMTPYQFSLITRYTNNLILLLDNDEAGEKGRARIINKFGSLANIRNFYLPDEYKDIDEFFSENKNCCPTFTFKD
jgi:DNA primase catalytic core